jgi:hypothetical protein
MSGLISLNMAPGVILVLKSRSMILHHGDEFCQEACFDVRSHDAGTTGVLPVIRCIDSRPASRARVPLMKLSALSPDLHAFLES